MADDHVSGGRASAGSLDLMARELAQLRAHYRGIIDQDIKEAIVTLMERIATEVKTVALRPPIG